MKKILLSLTIVLFALSGMTQDYIPFLSGNGVWKSYGIDNSQPSTEVNVDVEYRLSEDTVIDGMDYRILEIAQSSPSSNYPDLEEAYLREDIENRMVFIRFQEEDQDLFNDNEELLLYDFSLEEGDFFELYEEFEGNEVNIVNDTTYTIDGEERRAWVTDFPAIISDTSHRIYVEGVGYLSDPLMPIFPDQFTFYRGYLYCYSNSENDIQQEFTYPWVPEAFNCNSTLSAENAQRIYDVVLYPNPTSGEFTVSGENLESIKIRDVLGQEILSQRNINEHLIEVKATLKSGIYLLEICNSAGTCTTERLVIDK